MQRFGLRLFCLSLHVLLVLGHLGLLVVWRVHAEYNIVFDVHLQSSVSLFVTALATALGTVYFAILLYFTQMLALHRNWQAGKTLTATHDNATAWVGLGSALVTMLDQIAVTSSVLGVLSIFGYLASLSLLHITTPALFSVEAFNITIPTTVSTQGFPQINTALDPDGSATREFVPRVVEFLPWIDHIPTPGLTNGSLYEVPDLNDGEASIDAIAFNISCGYLSAVQIGLGNLNDTDQNLTQWKFSVEHTTVNLYDTVPNTIRFIETSIWNNTVVLYSTVKIVDSQGNTGMPVQLDPPMSMVSELYFFQCSKLVVPQTGKVDCRTKESSSLTPVMHKHQSAWRSDTLPPTNGDYPAFNPVMVESDCWSDMVAVTLATVAGSGIQSDLSDLDESPELSLSLVDVYLMQHLGLSTYSDLKGTAAPPKLHDLENTLSGLVASVFWIIGHIRPGSFETAYRTALTKFVANLHVEGGFVSIPSIIPPVLTASSTVVRVPTPAARLKLSIVAVSGGLASSIFLLILVLPHLRQPVGRTPPLSGTGLLHIIWLLRNYPEVADLVPQVADPTDHSLRAAGMVKVESMDEEINGGGEAGYGYGKKFT